MSGDIHKPFNHSISIAGLLILLALLCSFHSPSTVGAAETFAGHTNQELDKAGTSAIPGNSSSLRAVTFNIRYENSWDGPHSWRHRRESVVNLLSSFDADLIGIQEALLSQKEFLAEKLPAYRLVFAGRDDGRDAGEGVGIAFRSERFELIEHGHFWLNETPDKPGAGWDAWTPRIVVWARLRDRFDEESADILVVSTHFDHWGKTARAEAASMIADLFGDLNSSAPDKLVAISAAGRD